MCVNVRIDGIEVVLLGQYFVNFRNDEGLTIVDVLVTSTSLLDPVDTGAIEETLQEALQQIPEEGQLEDLKVDFSGSTDVVESGEEYNEKPSKSIILILLI